MGSKVERLTVISSHGHQGIKVTQLACLPTRLQSCLIAQDIYPTEVVTVLEGHAVPRLGWAALFDVAGGKTTKTR